MLFSIANKTNYRLLIKHFCIIFLLFISIQSYAQDKYFVNDASTTGDVRTTSVGSDVTGAVNDNTQPFATVQKILDDFTLVAGDSIIIDAGTYSENDIVPDSDDDGFVLTGIDSTLTVFDNNITDGEVWLNFSWDSDDVTVQNLTVREYKDAAGGALEFHGTNTGMNIKNVRFYKNQSTSFAGVIYVMWDGVEFTFTSCSFESNSAVQHGAVYYTNYENGSWDFTDCTFNSNQAGTGTNFDGGVVYISQFTAVASTMAFNRCYFYSNVADDGSVMFNAGNCNITLTNSLLYENTANDNGVLYAEETSNAKYTLMNCTVADNVSNDASLGGGIVTSNDILDSGAGTVDATNCILYGNTNYDMREAGGSEGVIDCDYCIYGSYSGGGSVTNSSSADPKYADATNDNYDIQVTSTAVNAATEIGAPSVDITNTARDVGDYDIGAYEQGNGPAGCTYPTTQATSAGNSSLDSTSVALTWTSGNGNKVLVVMKEGSAPTDPADGSTYAVSTDWTSKGDDVGSSSYAILDAAATSTVTVTNLDYATTYYVGIYEYSTTGDCYLTPALSYNFTTDSAYIYVDDLVATDDNTADKWCTGAAGDDVGGNGTVGTPYATVQKAMDMNTLKTGHVIRVDNGTYVSDDDDIDPADSDDNFSIIGASIAGVIFDQDDGVGVADERVFTFENNSSITIKNATIIDGGKSANGGGMYFYETGTATLTLTNVVMSNNSNKGAVNQGGALDVRNSGAGASNFVATNCVFNGNYGGNQGGAINFKGDATATYTITNCKFYDDTSKYSGSAVHVEEGNIKMVNCLMYENLIDDSGGSDGTVRIKGSGTDSLINCTITDNANDGSGSGGDAGLSCAVGGGSILVLNCIIYNNVGDDIVRASKTMNVDYTDYETTSGTMTIDANSIQSDPLFVDATHDNYDIQAGSSCKDDGTTTKAPSDDITGTVRDGSPDMGAYEQGSISSSCSYPATQATTAGNSSLDSIGVTLTWVRGSGDKVLIVMKEGSAPSDPTDGSTYNVSSDWSAKGSDVGSSSYVIYDGTGTTMSVTKLDYAKTYYVEMYEYTDVTKCYKTAPLSYNFTTDSMYLFVNDGSTTNDVWCSAIGNDANAGTAAAPYATITQALSDHTMKLGAVIRVDNGTYTPSSAYNPGNEDVDFTIVGVGSSGTIIDPSSTNRAFWLENNGSITLKNMTLNGGAPSTNEGGLIYFDESNEVTFTLIGVNISNGVTTLSEGGGLALLESGANNSNLVMQQCSIFNNSPGNHGGGLYLAGGAAATYTIDRCFFYGNTVGNSYMGSAIYETTGLMTVTNCLFFENENGSNFVKGCVRANTGTDNFVNCTFADNTGADAGIFNDVGTTNVTNCLFYNNSGDDMHEDGTIVATNCYYSSVQDGPTTSTNNLTGSVDMFADRANDNYDITDGSAAEDAGENTGAPTDDITSTTRLGGGNVTVDIGAYEQGNSTYVCPDTVIWTGGVNNSWAETGNWNGGVIPCGTDVIINDVVNEPTLDTKGQCANLTINGASVLTWATSDSLIVSGNLDVNSTSSVIHSSSGVFYLSGTTKTIQADAGVGLSLVPLTVAGNYTLNTDLTIDDLNIESGGTLTVDSGQDLVLSDDLVIGGTLTLSGTSSMSVNGNFTNNGTFNANTSLVTFNGSLGQLINGTANTTFSDLTINNSSGITLSNPTTVGDDLTLTDGIITTTQTNILIMDNSLDDDAQDIIGGNSGDYINGPVRIVGYASSTALTDTLKVPVGDGTAAYSPVWIIPASTNANTWEVRYADTAATTKGAGAKCIGNFKNVSAYDMFRIRRVSGTSNARLRFYWNDTSRIVSAVNLNDLVLAHFDAINACWEILSTDTSTYTRDFAGKWIETEFDVTDYSPFSFATKEGLIALPVQLVDFDAILSQDKESVELLWNTATEMNAAYYELEKRVGKGSYEKIGTIEAQGTVSTMSNYSFTDDNASVGITDYRLIQVGLNNDQEYIGLTTVVNTRSDFDIIITDKELQVYASDWEDEILINVVNVVGKVIVNQSINENETIDLSHVSGGIYFISISNSKERIAKKIYLD